MPSDSVDLLTDLDALLRELRRRERRSNAVLDCVKKIEALKECVVQRPRVVLLGESNSGKTALANLLIADSVLPESVLTNTRRPTILRHSQSVTVTGITSAGTKPLTQASLELGPDMGLAAVEVAFPNPRLEHFDLVDTPGLSDPDEIPLLQLRPSDLLIWCTVATQAWKESERVLWRSFSRRHRQNGIVVATHLDGLQSARDADSVRARLRAETRDCSRAVAMVSSVTSDADSGLKELETLIGESLEVIMLRRHSIAYRMAVHVAARAASLLSAA